MSTNPKGYKFAPPPLPTPSKESVLGMDIEAVAGGATLEELIQCYLIDYSMVKTLKRMQIWKHREKTVAPWILERDDVQTELSLRQMQVTPENMAQIRASAMSGLYALSRGAESEAVRLAAINKLLDITAPAQNQGEDSDIDVAKLTDAQLHAAVKAAAESTYPMPF